MVDLIVAKVIKDEQLLFKAAGLLLAIPHFNQKGFLLLQICIPRQCLILLF